MSDPVELAAALVRCPSVTPAEGGALALLETTLAAAGFACSRIRRGGIDNLYARIGATAPVFGFNGHTDVVPVGDAAAWSADPFGAEIRDGALIGRGSVDMKSGVAAFATAAMRVASRLDGRGSVALLITGDEEGEATDGTAAILDWMAARGERLDFCLVGEPTSTAVVGDAMKIGRRGSANAALTVAGRQGHSAYPERAENPLPALARIAARLAAEPLDAGTEHFQPSTLALTSIDVGNPASNVIPAEGRLRFNLRFNDRWTGPALRSRVEAVAAEETAGTGLSVRLDWSVSGEAFLTEPDDTVAAVRDAVAAVTGTPPALSTGGGTSDARFVKDHCPVVELGLVGRGMHAVDEAVPVADVRLLADLYERVLARYFDL